jgi:hypothetical protein
MQKPSQHLIAEVPRKRCQVEPTISIDLGDVWSHYCALNQQGEVIDRGRFRTTPKAIEKWFVDVPQARVAMEAGVHSIWISEQLKELGHEVIVANVRELRAISHSDRKSDEVDAEKSTADCSSDCRAATSLDFDSCTRSHGQAPHGSDQRSSRSDEGLRAPYARLRDSMFRSVQHGGEAARTGRSPRPGSSADRRDDIEDQAV